MTFAGRSGKLSVSSVDTCSQGA